MASALASVIEGVRAEVVVVSYNDEAWLSLDELVAMCAVRSDVGVLAFDSKRYVGAQIGIHNPRGVKVGEVSHLSNTEIMIVAGPGERVEAALAATAAPALSR